MSRQVVGQCFGIALLALAVAWWPDRSAEGARSSLRGALTYNALTALFLAYLGTARHIGGVLLWPAVALHVVVSFLLITTWRAQHRKKPAASTSAKISG